MTGEWICSSSVRQLHWLWHRSQTHADLVMLNYAITFFVIAIIAAVLGFSGIAGSAANIAQILFLVFLVLAVISFLTGRRSVL